jgi:NTP pyrophosphatase (non-canonical NTP hydrolase)
MTYYLYHIPGKKIGVTCNLNNRVTLTQGYGPDEYEVLDQSEDIDYISEKEIELQKSYGYKIDRKKYNELVKLNKKMKINVTEQTTTFPYPVNKLKGHLMDNIGMEWKTEHGALHLTLKTIPWIMKNVKTSMYNNNRSYVYNKAFARLYDNNDLFSNKITHKEQPIYWSNAFDFIRDWAETRGLYEKGNTHTQYVKLQEEAGELAKALLQNDHDEVNDAIGDMVVVLTNLAHLHGTEIEQCITDAYRVISKRTGKMINGTFVKDE